jgi:hypothetical protein
MIKRAMPNIRFIFIGFSFWVWVIIGNKKGGLRGPPFLVDDG